MKRSTDRIIVSHAGTLPRPDDIAELLQQDPNGNEAFHKRLPSAVKEAVQKQVETGIDIVNDGEFGKIGGFSGYPRQRLSGLEMRHFEAGQGPPARDVQGRDRRDFPGFAADGFPARFGGQPGLGSTAQTMSGPRGRARDLVYCTGPV